MALIAMGEAGLASRVLAARIGSCWTYAGDGVAPGQISAARLHDEFRFRRIGARTAIYGISAGRSRIRVSPAMHNAAFRAAQPRRGLSAARGRRLRRLPAFADAVDLAGASVTAPFKVDAFERADECDPVSRRIAVGQHAAPRRQAVAGCNTDVAGFLAPLQSAMRAAGRARDVLGAGGAARVGRRGARVGRRARDDRRARDALRPKPWRR